MDQVWHSAWSWIYKWSKAHLIGVRKVNWGNNWATFFFGFSLVSTVDLFLKIQHSALNQPTAPNVKGSEWCVVDFRLENAWQLFWQGQTDAKLNAINRTLSDFDPEPQLVGTIAVHKRFGGLKYNQKGEIDEDSECFNLSNYKQIRLAKSIRWMTPLGQPLKDLSNWIYHVKNPIRIPTFIISTLLFWTSSFKLWFSFAKEKGVCSTIPNIKTLIIAPNTYLRPNAKSKRLKFQTFGFTLMAQQICCWQLELWFSKLELSYCS